MSSKAGHTTFDHSKGIGDVGATEFPLEGSPGEQLAWTLQYAILAPSSRNSQPWLFHIDGDVLELRADRTRALPVVDPHGRELEMSCAAALLHVRAALRKAGQTAVVESLPEPACPDLLARVTLGEPAEPSRDEKLLFWAMRTRRTNRRRYERKPVPEELLARLEAAALAEGARFVVLRGDAERKRLADLVAAADRVQNSDQAFRHELASWLHPNRADVNDGMPGASFGHSDVTSTVGPFVVRTFERGRGRPAKDRQLAAGSPVLAVLTTDGDSRADWLAAGQALARVLLTATDEDVVASFLNQPLQVPELRREVAALTGGMPQLALRLGYAERAPQTPRRPADEILR